MIIHAGNWLNRLVRVWRILAGMRSHSFALAALGVFAMAMQGPVPVVASTGGTQCPTVGAPQNVTAYYPTLAPPAYGGVAWQHPASEPPPPCSVTWFGFYGYSQTGTSRFFGFGPTAERAGDFGPLEPGWWTFTVIAYNDHYGSWSNWTNWIQVAG